MYCCNVKQRISLVSDSVWVTSVVLIRFGVPLNLTNNPVVSDSVWVTLVVLTRLGFPHNMNSLYFLDFVITMSCCKVAG